MRLYANVYRSLNGAMGSVWETRELADWMAGRGRIACVEFSITEGLGAAVDADKEKHNEPDAKELG